MVFGFAASLVAGEPIPQNPDFLKPSPLLNARFEPIYYYGQTDKGGKTFIDMSAQDEPGKQLSMRKAMLLSLLCPGAGQYYAGEKFKGQVFMGIELAVWTGFVAYRVYGGWKEDDYKDYASAHAGVYDNGKDEEFYDWVGFYDSRDEFNLLGRLYYPDRAYLPDTREYYWQWDSDENRLVFKDLKDASKRAFRNSTFMLGLALLNRLVAGIDTYRTVKSAQQKMRSLTEFGDYRLKIDPKFSVNDPGLQITLTRKI